MLRFGTVTDRQPNTCRVKVSFLEDGLVTQWIPVLVSSVGGNKFFSLPEIGDQVAVAMQDADIGVVLGAFYSDSQGAPQGVSGDVTMVEFSDGVTVKYDRSSKDLTITGEPKITVLAQNIIVASQGQVTVEAPEIVIDASTEHNGNVVVNGNLEVNGSMSGSGNLSVEGNVDADGEVTAKAGATSVSLSTHLHTSGGPGSPTTPPTAGT